MKHVNAGFITLCAIIAGAVYITLYSGCAQILEDRGFPEVKGGTQPYIGSTGTGGDIAIFLRPPKGARTRYDMVLMYFGNVSYADEYAGDAMGHSNTDILNTITQMQGTICEDTMIDAVENFNLVGFAPGMPGCVAKKGGFVWDCSTWSYYTISIMSAATLEASDRSGAKHLNRLFPASGAYPDNAARQLTRRYNFALFDAVFAETNLERVPMPCRAIALPIDFPQMDIVLVEAMNFYDFCPTAYQKATVNLNNVFVSPTDLLEDFEKTILDTLAYKDQFFEIDPDTGDSVLNAKGEDFVAKVISLVDPHGIWLHKAFTNPASPWAATPYFLLHFLDTAAFFPSSAMLMSGVGDAMDFSVDLSQLVMPVTKDFTPDSEYSTRQIWPETYDELLVDIDYDHLHPTAWIDNITGHQLTLCEDLYRQIQFIDPNLRSPVPKDEDKDDDDDSGNGRDD